MEPRSRFDPGPNGDSRQKFQPIRSPSFGSLGFTAGRLNRPERPRDSRAMPLPSIALAGVALGTLATAWLLLRPSVCPPGNQTSAGRWGMLGWFGQPRLGNHPAYTRTILIARASPAVQPVPPDFVGPPRRLGEWVRVSRLPIHCDPWNPPPPCRLEDLSNGLIGSP